MDKIPGKILRDCQRGGATYDEAAAAIIASVRPQIEAEARAVTLADAAKLVADAADFFQREDDPETETILSALSLQIRNLVEVPPGHVRNEHEQK